jgi:hypothetical protein
VLSRERAGPVLGRPGPVRRPISRFRQCVAGALVLAVGALVAACGIPTGSPRAIPSGQVPVQVISPTLPITPTTLSGGVLYYIFLLTAQGAASGNPVGALVAKQRYVGVKGGLTELLGYLVDGPDSIESLQGVQTAISPNTEILSVTPPPKGATGANDVVTVNFNSVFAAPGSSTVLAVQQVVYTIDTALSSNTGVVFEIDGEPTDVPLQNGAATPGPVSIANYPNAETPG